MLKKSFIALVLIVFSGTISEAKYDVVKQVKYTRQMLAADIDKTIKLEKEIKNDNLQLEVEYKRALNEELTYERLSQEEQNAQALMDEAKISKERDKAMLDRDRLVKSLKNTRLWLAAHELDVSKLQIKISQKQLTLDKLEHDMEHLNQVLVNDGVKRFGDSPPKELKRP